MIRLETETQLMEDLKIRFVASELHYVYHDRNTYIKYFGQLAIFEDLSKLELLHQAKTHAVLGKLIYMHEKVNIPLDILLQSARLTFSETTKLFEQDIILENEKSLRQRLIALESLSPNL